MGVVDLGRNMKLSTNVHHALKPAGFSRLKELRPTPDRLENLPYFVSRPGERHAVRA